MTVVDWAIVALALVLAPIGYRQGLLVAVLALGGFAAGAAAGARLAPLLLEDGAASPYAPAIALLGGIALGGILATFLQSLGFALRRRLQGRSVPESVDSVGGAIAYVALALGIAWVTGALALNAPALRGIRADVQRSTILAAVNGALPPSGPILNVLNRIDPTPTLAGPSADVAEPDPAILDDPDVEGAADSVVRIVGVACGLNVSGSGWAAGDELVVTNAHVLAGQEDPAVLTADGRELDADPVAYRPSDDIAVLRVPGLGLTPLELNPRPRRGTPGAVLGYPGAGDFTVVPARLGTTGEVTSQDSYGRGPVQRRMTSFRAEVISGNSGGPVVGEDGEVLTTVFAATVDSRRQEGLGVPNGVTRSALQRADRPVDTGPCA